METTSLGRRVASLRADRGWSQEQLAARISISRVALSHIEAGMSTPSERTIVLLAGRLHVEPRELVAGTSYPAAKTERLPHSAPRYTELEHQLLLLDAALTGDLRCGQVADVERWKHVLDRLDAATTEPDDRALVREARKRLAQAGRAPDR